jgi:hypothetical protein
VRLPYGFVGRKRESRATTKVVDLTSVFPGVESEEQSRFADQRKKLFLAAHEVMGYAAVASLNGNSLSQHISSFKNK